MESHAHIASAGQDERSGVLARLDDFEKELAILHDSVSKIGAVLEPVLRPEEPSPEDGVLASVRPSGSITADRLVSLVGGVSEARARVEALVRRIDL